jgi:RecJ-like exonuclease
MTTEPCHSCYGTVRLRESSAPCGQCEGRGEVQVCPGCDQRMPLGWTCDDCAREKTLEETVEDVHGHQ